MMILLIAAAILPIIRQDWGNVPGPIVGICDLVVISYLINKLLEFLVKDSSQDLTILNESVQLYFWVQINIFIFFMIMDTIFINLILFTDVMFAEMM